MQLPIPLPSAAEMRAIDLATIQSGIPSLTLMERAGSGVVEIIREQFASELGGQQILIFCGPGNNGGDGLVIARLLKRPVTVVIASSDKYSADFLAELEPLRGNNEVSLRQLGSGHLDLPLISMDELQAFIKSSSLIIDALLGTGSSGAPRGSIKEIIDSVPKKISGKIVAVDIPSGIDADTGQVPGAAINADCTVTIEYIKRGMLQSPAKENCGRIWVAPIGLTRAIPTEFRLLAPTEISSIPKRESASHKGRFGHVFVIGGSRDMPGAPVLSGISALRSGAGLVSIVQLASLRYEVKFPELMLQTVSDRAGCLGLEAISEIKDKITENFTLVLGPGLGQAESTKQFLEELLPIIRSKRCKVVLDADGLNLLGLREYGAEWVLTPHPGEMARLLGIGSSSVNVDRYQAARTLSEKTNSVVVLKGAGSIVYFNGHGWVNTSGNPSMATAGSGDVLAGLIAGIMAQGLNAIEATKAAVFLHGVAGDIASQHGVKPIIASDIASNIPEAMATRRE